MFLCNNYISLITLKNYKNMTTITNKQVDNLLLIAGNLCALEETLQKAINSNNLELIDKVRYYLTVVRERLMSTINDIDR